MNLNNEPKPVADDERAEVDRSVLIWLNTYPNLPVGIVSTMSQLGVNEPGMAVEAITSAYIDKPDILGNYSAVYQFTLVYRIKPGNSMDKSLQATELLNRIGDWAMKNPPFLGERIHVQKVEPISPARMYTPYEDGDEDHHIPIKITYEVT